jgi:hypothetical protein
VRHHAIKRIEAAFDHFGSDGLAGIIVQQPGTLPEVVQDQAGLYEDPGVADVPLAAVPQIGIQGFRTRGAQEHATENIKSFLVGDQQLDAIPGIEGLEDVQVVGEMVDTQHGQGQEPDGHDRAEEAADKGRAELLQEKEHAQDGQYDIDNAPLADIMQCRHLLQALNGRSDRDGRRDHAVSKQGGATDHGRHYEPALPPPHEGKERKDASFPAVVGPEGEDHIFDRCLKGQCPDDERKGSGDQFFGDRPAAGNGIEHVKRRGTDVAINNSKCNEQTTKCRLAVMM